MKMEHPALDNYIVRIYRRDGKDSQRVAGIVEEVGVKGNQVFHNLEELWTILTAVKSTPVRKGRNKDIGRSKEKKY
ncbi:MAG: hypothetical protein HZC13_03985 [Nitrospirae bacterium]|nr:hypothetical protein [Nitrospirota bacterium]MBI5096162.1 hypothetical protein [Nitrospirota bacterium]